MTPLVEARDVVLSFGATPALQGADFGVERGEIVAIMGPSGSGKTTLLHCLAGILAPQSGEIWFAGRRIDALRETERSRLRRERFGFVFQFGQLVPELDCRENAALPLCRRDATAAAVRAAGAWSPDRMEGLGRRRSGELSAAGQRVARPRAGRPTRAALRRRGDGRWTATGAHVRELLVSNARDEGHHAPYVPELSVAAYPTRGVVGTAGNAVTVGPRRDPLGLHRSCVGAPLRGAGPR